MYYIINIKEAVYKVNPQSRGWLNSPEGTKRSIMRLSRIIPCPYGEVHIYDLVNDTYATVFQIFNLGNTTAFNGIK